MMGKGIVTIRLLHGVGTQIKLNFCVRVFAPNLQEGNMQTTDWITAIVALYAAVISSYLGYREIRKERRRIKMILEYMTYREIVRLIVDNDNRDISGRLSKRTRRN